MSGILLFEQNTFFRKMLVRILRSSFPYALIKWVGNRDGCLIESYDFTPDIFLLGLSVYSSRDLDLIDLVREKYPFVTIILFTDYDIDEYRKDAVMRGANHVISKELWTVHEILALINTILASKNALTTMAANSWPVEVADFLHRPLERRRRDRRARIVEQQYLARNPGRRLND